MPVLSPCLRVLALPLCGCVLACSAPRTPWEGLGTERRWAVATVLPVATQYELDGEFFGVDLATNEVVSTQDSGRLEGKAGAGLRVERFWNADWSTALGVEAREFDVKGLSPFGAELPLRVDTISAVKIGLQLKRRFAARAISPAWRPWLAFELGYLPDVSGDVTLDLSSFGSSDLLIESRGDPYFEAALQAGLTGHVSEHLLLELMIAYERPIGHLDADLSFEIAGETVPLTAEYEPNGFVLSWGLTWVF